MVRMLYLDVNRQCSAANTRSVKPVDFNAGSHLNIDEQSISTLFSESLEHVGLKKVKELASEKQSTLLLSDDQEEAQIMEAEFPDTAKLDELNEFVTLAEQYNVEQSEISPNHERGHQITIRSNKLTRSRKSYSKPMKTPFHVLRTQMELLNGRSYLGHWETS